jgi:hypothetical protein
VEIWCAPKRDPIQKLAADRADQPFDERSGFRENSSGVADLFPARPF